MTDVETEAPILWPPDVKNWLIGKDPDTGKDWRQEEKWPTENEMVEWHHILNGYEFEYTLGVSDGWSPGVLPPWGRKELDTTEQLNWTELYLFFFFLFLLLKVYSLSCSTLFYILLWWFFPIAQFFFSFFSIYFILNISELFDFHILYKFLNDIFVAFK